MSGNVSVDWVFVDNNNVSLSSIKTCISAYLKLLETNFKHKKETLLNRITLNLKQCKNSTSSV